MDLLEHPPTGVPTLLCRRISDRSVETASCPWCLQLHIHGRHGVDDKSSTMRVAHCVAPDWLMREGGPRLKDWRLLKARGYRLQLVCRANDLKSVNAVTT